MSKHWDIKTLWIGEALSLIEQLSLLSFLQNEHQVELFAYGKVDQVPEGVIVRDANEILPEKDIFIYKKKKSYAGFANWFRYELFFKEAGVWVDTDVICMKPFDFSDDFFFGLEHPDRVNNAVLGSNPGNPLFRHMARQAQSPNDFFPYDTIKEKQRKIFRKFITGNRRNNVRWGEVGPIGLTRALKHFGLFDQAKPVTAFYPIHSSWWATVFDTTFSDPERYFPDSYTIHLWNEKMRRQAGFNKNGKYPEKSLIEYLKRKYLN